MPFYNFMLSYFFISIIIAPKVIIDNRLTIKIILLSPVLGISSKAFAEEFSSTPTINGDNSETTTSTFPSFTVSSNFSTSPF